MKEKGDKMRDHFLCFNNFSQSTRDQACHWYANNHRVIATGKAFISCWGTKGKKEKREIIQVEWEILAHVFTADEKNDNEFFLFLLSPVVFTTLLYSSFSLSLTFFLFIIYTWRRRQESERRNARYTSFCLQLRSLHKRPRNDGKQNFMGIKEKTIEAELKREELCPCVLYSTVYALFPSQEREEWENASPSRVITDAIIIFILCMSIRFRDN